MVPNLKKCGSVSHETSLNDLWLAKVCVFYRKLTPLTDKGSGSVTKKNTSPQFADSGFPLEECQLNKMAAQWVADSSRTAVKEASKEAAFEAFRAEFTQNG